MSRVVISFSVDESLRAKIEEAAKLEYTKISPWITSVLVSKLREDTIISTGTPTKNKVEAAIGREDEKKAVKEAANEARRARRVDEVLDEVLALDSMLAVDRHYLRPHPTEPHTLLGWGLDSKHEEEVWDKWFESKGLDYIAPDERNHLIHLERQAEKENA